MPHLSWTGCEPARCLSGAVRGPDSSGRWAFGTDADCVRCSAADGFHHDAHADLRREAQRQTRPGRRSKLQVLQCPRSNRRSSLRLDAAHTPLCMHGLVAGEGVLHGIQATDAPFFRDGRLCCSPEEAMTMETVYSSGRRRPHMSLLSVPDFSFVGLHRRLCPHFRPSLVSVHASGFGAGGAIPGSWSFVELRLRQHVCAALAPAQLWRQVPRSSVLGIFFAIDSTPSALFSRPSCLSCP